MATFFVYSSWDSDGGDSFNIMKKGDGCINVTRSLTDLVPIYARLADKDKINRIYLRPPARKLLGKDYDQPLSDKDATKLRLLLRPQIRK